MRPEDEVMIEWYVKSHLLSIQQWAFEAAKKRLSEGVQLDLFKEGEPLT